MFVRLNSAALCVCLVFVVIFMDFDALYATVVMFGDVFDTARNDDWSALLYNLPDLCILLVEIVIDLCLLNFEQFLYLSDVLLKHLVEFVVELLLVFDNVIFDVFVALHQLRGVNGIAQQAYIVQKC